MPIRALGDGTKYQKAVNYDDRVLVGCIDVYRKIDGLRAMRNEAGEVRSRNDKPLLNLDHLTFKDAEIFRTDWSTTVSLVRNHNPTDVLTQDDVYELTDGAVDERLFLFRGHDITAEWLWKFMANRVKGGDEGIIVRHVNKKGVLTWYKLVPEKFADVRITGYKEGTGKNKGMLGSFSTNYGSVGTGFTDEQRIDFWARREALVGTIIEVAYRETTEDEKFRFPSYRRERFDKDEESV